jgi:uncharacterized membrane protein
MAAFFSNAESDRIVAAIAAAEGKTSGEIRVHITNRVPADLEQRAVRRFHLLGMAATKERNGVLLYIAPRAHKFHLLGDLGIHERCGPGFWQEVAAGIETHFRKGEFLDGVLEAVGRIGEALAKHFPMNPHDVNELPDTVTED